MRYVRVLESKRISWFRVTDNGYKGTDGQHVTTLPDGPAQTVDVTGWGEVEVDGVFAGNAMRDLSLGFACVPAYSTRKHIGSTYTGILEILVAHITNIQNKVAA